MNLDLTDAQQIATEVVAHWSGGLSSPLRFLHTALERSLVVPPRLCFSFQHERSHLLLDITFTVLAKKKVSLLGAYVRKPDGANFSVADYLKQYSPRPNSLQFHCGLEPVLLRTCIRTFLAGLEALIEGELAPYLDGTTWPSITIDWGSYK